MTWTVARYVKEVWLPAKLERSEPHSREALLFCVNSEILPCFGQMPLTDVKPYHLEQWFDSLKAVGTSRSVSDTLLFLVRDLFNHALQNDFVLKNPAEFVELPRLGPVESAKSVERIIKASEAKKLETASLLFDRTWDQGEAGRQECNSDRCAVVERWAVSVLGAILERWAEFGVRPDEFDAVSERRVQVIAARARKLVGSREYTFYSDQVLQTLRGSLPLWREKNRLTLELLTGGQALTVREAVAQSRSPLPASCDETGTAPAHAANGGQSERRAAVNDYIQEVFARTGKRITRTDIWKAARYRTRTEFERWERNDPERPNRAADERFTRILNEKPHLK